MRWYKIDACPIVNIFSFPHHHNIAPHNPSLISLRTSGTIPSHTIVPGPRPTPFAPVTPHPPKMTPRCASSHPTPSTWIGENRVFKCELAYHHHLGDDFHSVTVFVTHGLLGEVAEPFFTMLDNRSDGCVTIILYNNDSNIK
jgi:hypothetical protein